MITGRVVVVRTCHLIGGAFAFPLDGASYIKEFRGVCATRARIYGPLPATKPSRIAVQVHRRPNGVLSRAGGDPT